MKVFLSLFVLFITGCSSAKKTVSPPTSTPAPVVMSTAKETIDKASEGGSTGTTIASAMELQSQRIKSEVPGAKVERIGEGIDITFDEQKGSILFSGNGTVLTGSGIKNLDKLIEIFRVYKDTDIRVEGHTDDAGTASSNMALSERRANVVASYLISGGISPHRLMIRWFGESQPKLKGTSPFTRSENRRIEIVLTANDKMKAEARK